MGVGESTFDYETEISIEFILKQINGLLFLKRVYPAFFNP